MHGRLAVVRLRVPEGWRITGAEANGQKLNAENGDTFDLSALRGDVKLRASVAKG